MIDFSDLFSGIGGIRLGLERTKGFKCVWSCDIDKYANEIYLRQWPNANHYSGDIRRVNPKDIPNHDLLCAGFPCQSFSMAGTRKGFEDTRGTLFFEICRIAKAKKPSWLLLENVTGLLNHDEGLTFQIILESLDELGYWVEWQVLNSSYIGPPQRRERVFIVGHLGERSGGPIFPAFNPLSHTDDKRRIERGPIVPTISTKQDRGTPFLIQESIPITNIDRHPTIRFLTPLECERLQGFPDNWTTKIPTSMRYKTIGNAVTVDVIEFLGKRILSQFTNNRGSK